MPVLRIGLGSGLSTHTHANIHTHVLTHTLHEVSGIRSLNNEIVFYNKSNSVISEREMDENIMRIYSCNFIQMEKRMLYSGFMVIKKYSSLYTGIHERRCSTY